MHYLKEDRAQMTLIFMIHYDLRSNPSAKIITISVHDLSGLRSIISKRFD
jgi:hypothetical protein